MAQPTTILSKITNYTKNNLRFDLIAGVTVGVVLVPQGMAYAILAGLPPIYGLYAGILPLILYAIFGSSPHLSIGPVAISSLLVLAGVSQVAEVGSEAYIILVILTGLLVGILHFLMGVFKMGFLINFLSHPVISGFTSAASIIIIVSQLKYLLGIPLPRFDFFHQKIGYFFYHLGETHLLTFLMGLGGIILMFILKKLNRFIPYALLTVMIGVMLVYFFKLDTKGVDIIGVIPSGLPAFYLPHFELTAIKALLPTVFTVTIIGMVEAVGIGKALEVKNDFYQIKPNKELMAIGIAKIGGAFFQAMPSSGSFGRSAINHELEAKTRFSSIFAAGFIILTLLFLTPVFFFLPKTLLAAVVIFAVAKLFDYQNAIHLWRHHRNDFWMLLATFIVTLLIGIEEGVLAGVVLSILVMTYKSSQPHVAVLGRLPDTKYFRNVNRFPSALQHEDVLMIRFDAPLYFTNADYFKNKITELANQKGSALKVLILDASSILAVDSTGFHAINEVQLMLKNRNIDFYMSGVLGPVRDLLYKTDMMDSFEKENQFMNLDDALQTYLCRKRNDESIWIQAAIQTNFGLK